MTQRRLMMILEAIADKVGVSPLRLEILSITTTWQRDHKVFTVLYALDGGRQHAEVIHDDE